VCLPLWVTQGGTRRTTIGDEMLYNGRTPQEQRLHDAETNRAIWRALAQRLARELDIDQYEFAGMFYEEADRLCWPDE